MNFKNLDKNTGFTLIEVIAIFVVGAILAAMAMPYFFSGAINAHTPIDRLQVSSNLNQAMEAVVADHDTTFSLIPATSTTLGEFANKITALYPACTATTIPTTTNWSLPNALLVTITSSTGEKIYHVFTVQK